MAQVFSQPVICPVLVGRGEALASLRSLLRGGSEHTRVVLISGEAGIGKSRLVAELHREALDAGYEVLQTRFFEQDATIPYSAFVRLLTDAIATRDNAQQKLGPFVSDLKAIAPELNRFAVDTTGASSLPEGTDESRRIAGALAKLLHSLSAEQPVLLVFEDLHWADAASLNVLLQVAREAEPRLMLALTYRDDEKSTGLDALLAQLDRDRLAAEVSLRRLSVSDVDQMLRAITGSGRSTRADFLHAVYQLTGGNPFFVEEIIRSFLDHAGSVEALDASQLGDFDVPRSVSEVLQRRTSVLSPAAREVLSLAAAAGTRFDFPLLAELSGRSEDELLGLMAELIAAQLVVEEAEDAFAFRHALTREAIRSRQLMRERRALSRRIGEAIEKLHADDLTGRTEDLAGHFYEAGDWPKALKYASQAGERALALYAPVAALGHLTRAIDAGSHIEGAQLAPVYLQRGSANETIGDFEAARADYERAAAEAEASGDPRTQWRSLLDLGLLWASRDHARSLPYCEEALAIAHKLEDATAIGHSLNRLGNWYSNKGDFETAQRMCEQALATFRAADDRAGVAQTLDLLGMTCYMGLRTSDGARYYREAIPVLEALDDRRTLTSALASIQIASGTYQTDLLPPALSLQEGAAFGERALNLARRMEWRSAEAYALWQLTCSLGPQGEYDTALAYGLEALAIAHQTEHTQWETAAECALGALYTDVLAFEEAETHLRRAIALSEGMGADLWWGQAAALLVSSLLAAGKVEAAAGVCGNVQIETLGNFGTRQLYSAAAEVALALGDNESAMAMVQRLEAEAERAVPGGTALRLARLRGRVQAASGDADGAIDVLRATETEARAQGNPSYAWRLNVDLAQTLLAAGDRQDAAAAAANAIELIDGLAPNIPDVKLREQFITRAMECLPGPLRRQRRRDHVEGLTAREAEIAALVAGGLTNREIADRLVLSARTIESHVANAMTKLGLANRSQLAAWAVEHGFSNPA